MDPASFYKATKHDDSGKLSSSQKNTERDEVARIYAEINKEIEILLAEGDRIPFSPAEDFEYTVPLEDFQKSQQGR
ncbi:MAG: hypothetical protein A3D65_05245 [Candidatus Lloydbacteria bacterium RIFCSPHIGHO2_02_FULL_50_13]|uniref:Uncharacterized protein n=1 Tax=Candidatus Lloydbacteria bacterium RIFCSPHIGHO2_02_FULL_50_13 TaxID=1798661 RepID=A0A1G2D7U0_9BACT|nr:MAG: hypothetical protein A3D65_05245 [Candidatus Lloydbacteria bacterium RIFCSPHIGHO2_02_FULL_50_13]